MLFTPPETTDSAFEACDLRVAEALVRALLGWNHAVLRNLAPEARDQLAAVAATAIRSVYPVAATHGLTHPRAQALREAGIVKLGTVLPTAQVQSLYDYFRSKSCYNVLYHGHVEDDGIARGFEAASAFHYGSFCLEDIVAAPGLLAALTSGPVLDLADAYLGAAATLHSVNVWWSFPQSNAHPMAQQFHRDRSHIRFCSLFVPLTELTVRAGAHDYVRASHRPDQLALALGAQADAKAFFELPNDGYGYDALYLERLGHLLETIESPAGEAFMADTYGIHRGRRPQDAPRLMAWARYSLHAFAPPHARVGAQQVAGMGTTDPRRRYALRAVVDFDPE